MKDLKISELNDIYGGLLTNRQSEALRHYYDFDLSYAEIAETFGITRQAIFQVIETSVNQLEAYERELGLLGIVKELNSLKQMLNDEAAMTKIDGIIASIGEKKPSC